jgi:hypothetical protein
MLLYREGSSEGGSKFDYFEEINSPRLGLEPHRGSVLLLFGVSHEQILVITFFFLEDKEIDCLNTCVMFLYFFQRATCANDKKPNDKKHV